MSGQIWLTVFVILAALTLALRTGSKQAEKKEASQLEKAKNASEDAFASSIKQQARSDATENNDPDLFDKGADQILSAASSLYEATTNKENLNYAADEAKRFIHEGAETVHKFKVGPLKDISGQLASSSKGLAGAASNEVGGILSAIKERNQCVKNKISASMQSLWNRIVVFFKRVFRIFIYIFVFFVALGLVGFLLPNNPVLAPIIEGSCYSRGIAYYKSIGSFPIFSTGEDTVSEVSARCARSNGMAFSDG